MVSAEDEDTNLLRATNLERWAATDDARKWVTEHPNPGESDWTALIERLRASSFWPMDEGSIRQRLKGLGHSPKRRTKFLSARLERPARIYIAGLAMIAAATGFFAGASSTPIVNTLLPLFFALIGGAGGIYVATANLQAEGVAWRIGWIGKALAAFGTSFLAFALIGISGRLYIAQAYKSDDLAELSYRTVQDGLQLAALRAKLRILEATPVEQKHILRLAAQEIETSSTPLAAARVNDIASRAMQVLDAFAAAKKTSAPISSDVKEDIDALVQSLQTYAHAASAWAKAGMPYNIYATLLDSMFFRLSQFETASKIENITWMTASGLDRGPLDGLYQTVHAEFLRRDLLDWRLGMTLSDKLDQLLKVQLSRGRVAEKPPELSPAEEPLKDEEKKEDRKPSSEK